MGYIFLLIALLAGATKGFCGKKTSGYTKQMGDAVFANWFRMLLCIVFGFFVVFVSGDLLQLKPDAETLLISVLSGVSSAIFVVTWLISVKKSAYMMLDIFLLLGILIPLICSRVFFGEMIKGTQWLGMALLFAAVLIMCSYNNSIKEKIDLTSFLLLLTCGASCGVADFSQKLFIKRVEGGSVAVFNFYTYVFAALVLTVAFLTTRRDRAERDKNSTKMILVFIPIMAVCLFLNSFFKTLAAEHLDAILLYPLNQGCGLILSSLMSVIFFKEKMNAKAIIGIVTAFAGLLVINLL